MRYGRLENPKAEYFGANQQIDEAGVCAHGFNGGRSSSADEFGGRFHPFKVDVTQSKQTMLNQDFLK